MGTNTMLEITLHPIQNPERSNNTVGQFLLWKLGPEIVGHLTLKDFTLFAYLWTPRPCLIAPVTICGRHLLVHGCVLKTIKSFYLATCEEIECDNYATCVTIDSQPKCQCPKKSECSTFVQANAVCGSDGIVYRNECYMKASSCEAGLLITVRNKGVCGM